MLQLDEVLEASEMDANIGFCIACGEHKVYGAEELLLSWGLPIGSGEIFAG